MSKLGLLSSVLAIGLLSNAAFADPEDAAIQEYQNYWDSKVEIPVYKCYYNLTGVDITNLYWEDYKTKCEDQMEKDWFQMRHFKNVTFERDESNHVRLVVEYFIE